MPLSVLLLSASEYGQINTILALATEMSRREQVAEIHIASFSPAAERVGKLSEEIGVPLSFHPYSGPSYLEAAKQIGLGNGIVHEPACKSLEAFRILDSVLAVYDADEYLRQIKETKALILDIDPDVIVVDMLLHSAFDACIALNRRFIVNSPIQALDICRMTQPRLKGLWYYPASVPRPLLHVAYLLTSFYKVDSQATPSPLAGGRLSIPST
jgi:hypothetical protein